MKKNKTEKLPHSQAVKAASVTAGVAAGTAAVTAAKLAHEIMSDGENEVIPVIDTEEYESIAEIANVENPNPVLETLVETEDAVETAPRASHVAASHHHAPVVDLQDNADNAPQMEEAPIVAEEELAEVIEDEAEVISDPIADLNNGELEVNVIGYDTVTMNDGTKSDFAFFENNGRQGVIVDSDQDGRADYMMLDTNGNGNIEESEVYDIHEENVEMAQFNDNPVEEVAMEEPAMDLGVVEDQFYALDDASSDYINDADVNAFLEA